VTVTIEGVLAACTTLLAVSAVLGLVVRLVLLPYLRDHLVTPVAEVREQVKNTHESNLREDIDGLAGRMDRLADSFDQARREDRQRWREHMAYSASIAERIERLERQRRPDDN
jgi:ABC-type transport system involved in cytochrome bd biosynthesis fused ATPase/permease subunit